MIEPEPIVVDSKAIADAVAEGDACKPKSPNSPSASRSGIQANTEQPTWTSSCPSCKKAKFTLLTPGITFPPGTIIMGIDDEKWVAVTNSDSIQDNA